MKGTDYMFGTRFYRFGCKLLFAMNKRGFVTLFLGEALINDKIQLCLYICKR